KSGIDRPRKRFEQTWEVILLPIRDVLQISHRVIGEDGNEAAEQDDRLASNFVGKRAEDDEERCCDKYCKPFHPINADVIELQIETHEEYGIELARIPHHPLPRRRAQ